MNTEQMLELDEIEGQEPAAASPYDLEKLNALGGVLNEKRREAVAFKTNSGVEDEWQLAEDNYHGVDDANRPEKESKPQGPNGGAGTSGTRRKPTNGTRSTVFVPITQPFVDFGAARACDILLPTDDRGFVIEPPPLTDVEDVVAKQDQTVINADGTTAADAGKMMLDEMKDGAERAQRRIDDWLAECGYNSESRKVIHDSGMIGTGVMKGPFASIRKNVRAKRTPVGDAVIEMIEKIQPKAKRISAWDLFPDPACGECIHNGSYIWERDRMPARGLQELKDLPGYIPEAIDLALKEGPEGKHKDDSDAKRSDCEQFTIWYFYGFLSTDDLKAAGEDINGLDEEKLYPVQVTMVNDRVIRCVESPLESGRFPYHVLPWSKKPGCWTGTGIATQMATPQRMVNAATRAMLDNAGKSSGPQIVADRNLIEPADGQWEITPNKLWWLTEEGAAGDVRKAFLAVDIPNNQAQLQNIINFALEMAERVTGLPLMAQGQQGAATHTVGGMSILDRNSNAPLRMFAKNHDDDITVPLIQAFYEWVLLYGDDPREKANYNVVARGSSVLFEKDAQNQSLMQMGQFVVNPVFGKSPVRWIDEVFRVQRLDPAKFDLTEEEKKANADAQAAAQQQGDPRLAAQKEIAMIRAQGEMEREKFRAVEADKQRQHDSQITQMELQQDMLQFMEEQKMSFEELKMSLAETTLRLRTQKELSLNRPAPQVANPPSEPAGKANPGEAYQA